MLLPHSPLSQTYGFIRVLLLRTIIPHCRPTWRGPAHSLLPLLTVPPHSYHTALGCQNTLTTPLLVLPHLTGTANPQAMFPLYGYSEITRRAKQLSDFGSRTYASEPRTCFGTQKPARPAHFFYRVHRAPDPHQIMTLEPLAAHRHGRLT